jgi:hypothetical protein
MNEYDNNNVLSSVALVVLVVLVVVPIAALRK